MQVVMDDRTVMAIMMARQYYSHNMCKLIKQSRVEIDRLTAENSDYTVMLLSLGGLLVTDDKFMVVEGD